MQIAELIKCCSRHAVYKQLQTLPRGLDETYDKILSRCDNSQYSHDVKHFLTWLAFSIRPLNVEELADAITADFSSKDVPCHNRDLQYFDSKYVLIVCSSLIVEFEGAFCQMIAKK